MFSFKSKIEMENFTTLFILILIRLRNPCSIKSDDTQLDSVLYMFVNVFNIFEPQWGKRKYEDP